MTVSLSRISLGALALLTGGLAQAQPVAQQMQPPSMVLARVVSATPQMRQVPVQTCDPAAAAPTGGGAAVGALAGGVIGSQMGSGNGHIAGAILGAIGGALAGNAIEAQNRAVPGAGCSVQYQNQVTGYDVIYEWSGRQYRTQMAAEPGQWIKVAGPVSDGSYAEPAYTSAAPQPPQTYPVPSGAPVAPQPGYGGYPAYPQPVYPMQTPGARAPIAGDQLIAYTPQRVLNVYPLYAPPAYPQPLYAPPGPMIYPAPVMVRPAPVYVGPPVGLSIGIGGGGGRRGGWGMGIGF